MIFKYKKSIRLGNDEIFSTKKLGGYISKLNQNYERNDYSYPESSIYLSRDEKIMDAVNKIVDKYKPDEVKMAVVIGIGGSNLGTWAVYDAVKPDFILEFAETVDPVKVSEIERKIRREYSEGRKVVLVFISKSGGTAETVANYSVLAKIIKELDSSWQEQVVIITDEGSKLWNYAKEMSFERLQIPELVGGRYSILSSVGLFPLTLAGVDAKQLKAGAITALKDGLIADVSINGSLVSATTIYLHMQQGISMHNTFIFAPQLATVGKWYSQLVGESLGKDGKGITPLTSLGTPELHSLLQLYLGGPKDKLTTFIKVLDFGVDYPIAGFNISKLVGDIEGNSMTELMGHIYSGVLSAYDKLELPYMEIILDKADAYNIGWLLQFKMMETMFLAQLIDVNAFDQPNVELYKEETRKILQSP